MRVLYAALVFLLLGLTAHAQAVNEKVRDEGKALGQQMEVTVLDPTRPYQWREGEAKKNTPFKMPSWWFDTRKIIAYGLLALVAAALIYVLWRSGIIPQLLQRARGRRAQADESEMPEALQAGLEGSNLSYEQLLGLEDRERGLRVALTRALLAAAQRDNLRLRRSFTARDILARLKPNGALASLVEGSEPVLYGGRCVEEQAYRNLLSGVAPLLGGRA
ncbi:MAG: hypothetical protein AAFO61_06755 [Pseudomonadota bacterium]